MKHCASQAKNMLQNEEKKITKLRGLQYPLYRSEISTTAEDWLGRKRVRDKTGGLWRVHDGLYDLTEFVKLHPGGKQWITSSRGTDITEAFEIHHLKGIAENYLSDYLVAQATSPRIQPFTFEKDGFYKTLKPKVASKLSELPKNVRKGSDKIVDYLLVTFLLLSVMSCWAWNYGVALGLSLTTLNSLVLSFLQTSAHNYFHRADNWRMYLFNLNGQSYEQWRISHTLSHHIFTNTVLDAELSFVEPYLLFLPYKDKPIWARVAFVYVPFIGIILFTRPIWRRIFGTTKSSEVSFKWPQIIQFFLPIWMLLLGGQSLLATLSIWIVTSLLSSFFFVFFGLTAGHLSPDTFFEGDAPRDYPMDWGEYQLKAVIDRAEYTGKNFISITGFGDHALHHLFPTLDQAELKYLYPVLLEHCKKHGIEFRTTKFYTALINVLRQMMRKD